MRTRFATTKSYRLLAAARSLLLLLAVSLATAVSDRAQAEERVPEPRLVFERTELDLGTREPGPKLEFVFPVKNTGSAPLEIIEAKPSCGCTVTRFDHEIPPGGAGTVTATLDGTNYRGPMVRYVSVRSNDPDAPTSALTLKVNLRPVIDVTPGPNLVFAFHRGERHEQIVTIQSFEPVPLRILKLESTLPYVKAEALPAAGDASANGPDTPSSQRVRISLLPDAPAAEFTAAVTIDTNSTRRPQLILQVRGYPAGVLVVTPPRLHFEHVPAAANLQTPVEYMVTLMKNEGTFKLLGVEADPALHILTLPDDDGQVCALVVRYQGGWKPGARQGTIVIKTSDPQRPRIEVPYTAVVEP